MIYHGSTIIPKLDAIAAVIFKIRKVEEGLLCESEKSIMEFATIIEPIIAEMKYSSVFRSCMSFMGPGTTSLVALENARRFIGIELNQKHIDLAYDRLVQNRVIQVLN